MSNPDCCLRVIWAAQGDALLLQYRDGEGQVQHTVLFDGGYARNWHELVAAGVQKPWPQLICLTHPDRDHKGGIVKLLRAIGNTQEKLGDVEFVQWNRHKQGLRSSAEEMAQLVHDGQASLT